MQMIYLLHSQLDEKLVRRVQAKLSSTLFGRPDAKRTSANDNAPKIEVHVTEEDIRGDLEFGRAA